MCSRFVCSFDFEAPFNVEQKIVSQATIIYFRSARKLNNKVESGGERETQKACRKKMVKCSRQESAFI